RAALGEAECQVAAAKDMGLILDAGLDRIDAAREVRVGAPEVFTVAEAGIEDAALAGHATPGDWEEAFLVGKIRVVAQEPKRAEFARILVLDDIHFLLLEIPLFADTSVRGMFRVTRHEISGHLRAMRL